MNATASDERTAHLLTCLKLARARGVGPRTARVLRDELGGLGAAFELPREQLLARGVPARIAAALHDPGLVAAAQGELDELRRLGLGALGWGGDGYPGPLGEIADPPLLLSFRGALRAEDARAVAIVGTRRATPEGRRIAYRLAAEMAVEGVTIVSGLARGIDVAAHEGALDAGGRTIAVLGSGLCSIYPPQHEPLAERIAASGAVVSELQPREGPSRHSFPRRNRVIVGLSRGVVVVEAGPRSGALITAELALQEGREVFAVPGSILEPLARGPNGLIREGAHLVQCAADVLDTLFGVERRSYEPPQEAHPERAALLAALARRSPASAEALAAELKLPWAEVVTALGQLELLGQVMRGPGGYVACRARGA